MPITYTTEERFGYILAVISGETNSPEMLFDCIEAILTFPGLSEDFSRLMIDHRQLVFSGEDNAHYGVALRISRDLHLESPLRIALVSRPERFHSARLYEPVGSEFGTKVKVFTSAEEASVWLTGSRDSALD
ncbi:hypothetical protein [Pseudodesulfovibrio sp.]|uniref:hypothetical protein n=1 Tax=unclassified Pseudodesulfovibrio TaxID=2661612 RepID=UPI003AFFC1C3